MQSDRKSPDIDSQLPFGREDVPTEIRIRTQTPKTSRELASLTEQESLIENELIFEERKQEVLLYFFTNVDKDVYAIKNMPPEVSAALMSRFSRTNEPPRELFWKEFLKNPDLGIADFSNLQKQGLTTKDAEDRARKFFRQILEKYGDESVADMAQVSVIFENVSPILCKVIQENILRASEIEGSSRYWDFREKFDSKYRYIIPADLPKEERRNYKRLADKAFKKYTSLYPKVYDHIKSQYPKMEKESDTAYHAAVHARVCDILREILPFGIMTTMGASATANDWSQLTHIMKTHESEEVRRLGETLTEELGKTGIIPTIMERALGPHGKNATTYRESVANVLNNESDKVSKFIIENGDIPEGQVVELIDYPEDALAQVCAYMMHHQTGKSFFELLIHYRNNREDVENLIISIANQRNSRFDKLPPEFEMVSILWAHIGTLGSYKDLQRQRNEKKERTPYNLNLGFYIPPEVKDMGIETEYSNLMGERISYITECQRTYPEYAHVWNYLVPHGAYVEWYTRRSLEQERFVEELRTGIGGHLAYREIELLAYVTMVFKDPLFEKLFKFVDLRPGILGRRESFNKIVERGASLT